MRLRPGSSTRPPAWTRHPREPLAPLPWLRVHPRPPRPPAPPKQQPDPRLARLPTSEEIAEEVRHRPIGAVLADICRDLGIVPSHPLWLELMVLVPEHGGNFPALFEDIWDRVLPQTGRHPPGASPPSLAPALR